MAESGSHYGRLGLAAATVLAVFALHFRYILVHFSVGGTPLDSGWFAYMFGTGNLALNDPQVVNNLTFYDYHFVPYLSAVVVAFHAIGLDGFTGFALHQGLAFALFAASLIALVVPVRSGFLFAAALIFVLVGDIVLQYASFPHIEIAILAFATLGAALWLNDHKRLAVVAFALGCLVREDGGLFVAAVLAAMAVASNPARAPRSIKAALAAAAIAIAVGMFAIKTFLFPGFSTFEFNYSGNHWSHVTPSFVLGRLADLVANPQAMVVIVSSVALALVSWRYLLFPLLMLPLIVLQLLALRDLFGHFAFYYSAPFFIIAIGQFIIAAIRAGQGMLRPQEPAALLVTAIMGSSPLLFAVSLPNSFPMLAATISQPALSVGQFANATAAAFDALPGACASYGVAALIPNDVPNRQLLLADSSLDACPTVFLFHGDAHYDAELSKVAGWIAGPVIEGRIERYTRP